MMVADRKPTGVSLLQSFRGLRDEDLLGAASYPNALFRNSAFRHDGNYLNGVWNGDVHPPVTQPLLSVPQP
jgi:polyisoprenoid-binding protein YceI